MDVRNIATVEPIVEHNGTTPVWYMMAPGTMRASTEGGALELVNEFEITGGGKVDPHQHPTHEFYYVLYGHGTMVAGIIAGNGWNLPSSNALFGQYVGVAPMHLDQTYLAYFDAGVMFALAENVQLDVGINRGLSRQAADYTVFTGLSFRL